MKTRKAFLPVAILGLIAAFGLSACNPTPAPKSNKEGGETTSQAAGDNSAGSDEVSLGEIVVTAAENKTDLLIGDTVQLTAKVGDTVLEGVEWKTRAAAVATVSDSGLVTAVGAGQVKIRAEKDGYDTGSITINVTKAPEKAAHTVIDLEHAEHYSPNDFWGMTWGSTVMGPGDSPVEDNSGATEDGHSLGWLQRGCKETLTFTSNKAAEVEIGISMAYNAEMDLSTALSVKFNDVEISMVGRVCEGPEDGDTNNYYDWHTTSFGKVNLIAGNNVLEIEMIGQGPNMDVFKVYSDDTSLQITVVEPAVKPQIVVTPAEVEIFVGETQQLTSATEGLTYTSSNAEVASVSATGLITGVAKGRATIEVTKEGMKKATVSVLIKEKQAAGTVLLEAEDGVLAEGTQIENDSNASGERSVGYLSDGLTITVTYTAEVAKEMKLMLVASSALMDWSQISSGVIIVNDQNLAECCTLTLNGAAIDLTGKVLEGSDSASFSNFRIWRQIDLGTVNLKAGENVFVFTAVGQGPNVDCIKLIDPNASQGGEGGEGGQTVTKYTVSFAAGQGASGEMASVEAPEGEYTLPECTFTAPDGMVFAGWSIPAANWWEQAQIKQAGDKVNLTAALSLTATWVKASITISFNAGDGTGEMAAVTVNPVNYTLPECTFTGPGTKVFAGWAIITTNQWGQQQTQIKQAGEKVTFSDNIELTATWKYQVTKSEQIDLSNAFVMEAEEATIAGAQTQQGGSPVENNESSHGGKDVGYMSTGASITFNFNASAAGKVKLVLMGRSASADWSDWTNPKYYDHALQETTSIKVNNVDVDVTGKGFLASDGKTSVQVDLGEVDVILGANTIVISALAQAPNIDCVALIDASGTITFTLPTA